MFYKLVSRGEYETERLSDKQIYRQTDYKQIDRQTARQTYRHSMYR